MLAVPVMLNHGCRSRGSQMRQLPSPRQIWRDPQTCASLRATAELFNQRSGTIRRRVSIEAVHRLKGGRRAHWRRKPPYRLGLADGLLVALSFSSLGFTGVFGWRTRMITRPSGSRRIVWPICCTSRTWQGPSALPARLGMGRRMSGRCWPLSLSYPIGTVLLPGADCDSLRSNAIRHGPTNKEA